MVHNGIEYADMQLICEAYHIMRNGLDMSPKEIAQTYRDWNKGELNSYLIEISAEVLDQLDPETGAALVDVIMDKAGQKGTGLWTAVSALQVGSPAQTITQAVFARSLSSFKKERVIASQKLSGPDPSMTHVEAKETVIKQLHDALYCSKICAYAQGFQLMNIAAKEHGWKLDFAEIAKIWRAGCIIRAVFLQSISKAYENDEHLENLLLDPFFIEQINKYQTNWRRAIASASIAGIPCPAMSSALSYYDSYRCEVLPANLLQGQRDFFGAHTFSRNDKPENKKYHIEWNTHDRAQVTVK
jgi:6-phosphogluconate dehydrogenase